MKSLIGITTLLLIVIGTATSATPAIWFPSTANNNASYVFLRPNISLASYFRLSRRNANSTINMIKIKVSAAQDNAPNDGKQRLLASYRLFINSIGSSSGSGKRDSPNVGNKKKKEMPYLTA